MLSLEKSVKAYILRPFTHAVACCYVLLGVVAQSLKPVQLLLVNCYVCLHIALRMFKLLCRILN